MKQTFKTIIVDDHPVVLQGFAFMLQDMPGVEIAGSFESAEGAMGFLKLNDVQLVLLDINLPGKNGIDACSDILALKPGCRVVAISNNDEPSIVQRMMQTGASGYLLKNIAREELLDCIHLVINGGTGLSAAAQKALDSFNAGDLPVITRREREVLSLLAAGLSTNDIAAKIFISPLTVESHRRNLLQKFSATNVAALIHRAMELKYID